MRPGGLCEVLDCGRKLLTTFDEKDVSRSKDATYHVELRRVEWLAIVEGRLQRFSYTPPDPIQNCIDECHGAFALRLSAMRLLLRRCAIRFQRQFGF